MDLSTLHCVAPHLCAQTSEEQSIFAIFSPGLRRRVFPTPPRQPLALAPSRTIRARDPPMEALGMSLGAGGEQCSSIHCISALHDFFHCGSHCRKRRYSGLLWKRAPMSSCYDHSHSATQKIRFDCLDRLPIVWLPRGAPMGHKHDNSELFSVLDRAVLSALPTSLQRSILNLWP